MTTPPLSHLKILDFSTLLPGPFASMLLADMGAEVTRIESPTRPDLVKMMPPFEDGISASHSYLNRSKRSVSLDLKHPDAREVIYRLIETHDIVLEQFRPGVMDRLGIGYDELKSRNPRLIYCSITGYGQTGPWRNKAGHDINYLSLSGLSSYSGRKASGPPPLGMQVADVAGGSLHGALGILAAALRREQTGEGAYIDISMTDAAFSLNAFSASGWLVGKEAPQVEGGLINGGSFYDYYRTADERYLSVGGLEPQFFRRLCQVLDCPELAGQEGDMAPSNQARLKETFAERIAKRTLAEWVEIFDQADACVEPVLSLPEAAEHPQMQAREMLASAPTASGGQQTQIACPVLMDNERFAVRFAGVQCGAHTREVLEELGYSEEEIRQREQAELFGKPDRAVRGVEPEPLPTE